MYVTQLMVADDSSYMRLVLKKALKEMGYTDVVEAETGKQAMEVFKKNRPDLVLLDIIFPDRSGAETLEEMLDIDPNAKVIMVTSVGQKPMIDKCMRTGANDYITKPVDNEKMENSIRKALG